MIMQDLGRETRKIADFLGLELDDEQVARIVKKNTFSNLKKEVGNTIIHRQGNKYGSLTYVIYPEKSSHINSCT